MDDFKSLAKANVLWCSTSPTDHSHQPASTTMQLSISVRNLSVFYADLSLTIQSAHCSLLVRATVLSDALSIDDMHLVVVHLTVLRSPGWTIATAPGWQTSTYPELCSSSDLRPRPSRACNLHCCVANFISCE